MPGIVMVVYKYTKMAHFAAYARQLLFRSRPQLAHLQLAHTPGGNESDHPIFSHPGPGLPATRAPLTRHSRFFPRERPPVFSRGPRPGQPAGEGAIRSQEAIYCYLADK